MSGCGVVHLCSLEAMEEQSPTCPWSKKIERSVFVVVIAIVAIDINHQPGVTVIVGTATGSAAGGKKKPLNLLQNLANNQLNKPHSITKIVNRVQSSIAHLSIAAKSRLKPNV